MSSQSLIPVYVLSGTLGSGKTTLLNRLLKEFPRTAVIINEIGSVGIDDQVLTPEVPVTLLAGGCICCSVQGTLSTTLRNLWMAVQDGSLPAFDRVIVETTGIASPSGVTEVLRQDRFVVRHFSLAAVLITVDATMPADLLGQPEVLDQIAAADHLLLTKADRVLPEERDALLQQVRGLAANDVPVQWAAEVDLQRCLAPVVRDRCRVTGVFQVLNLDAPAPSLRDFSTQTENKLQHDFQQASQRWRSTIVDVDTLMDVLDSEFAQMRGALLRAKGIFRVQGEVQPVLVPAVRTHLEMPESLSAWPDTYDDHRLVIIARSDLPNLAQDVMRRIVARLS